MRRSSLVTTLVEKIAQKNPAWVKADSIHERGYEKLNQKECLFLVLHLVWGDEGLGEDVGRLCPLLGRREKWGIIGRGAHHVYGTSTDRDTDGSINFKNGNSSKNKTRNDTQYNKMRHRYEVFSLQFSGFYFISV